MSCTDQNINNGINQAVHIPGIFETVSPGDLISNDPERNKNLKLESGQYKVRATAEITTDEEREPFTLKNFDMDIPDSESNEFKRVRVFKYDSVPVSDTERKITVKFALIDNPVWLAPLLWTLPAVGGWFVVDKVESFAEKSPVSFGGLLLAAISAMGIFFFSK